MKLTIKTPEAMEAFGLRLASNLQSGDLVLLSGELGAGKTTMTRGIGSGLKAVGTIQSPTFVLARTHRTKNGPKLVHVDAYRLSSAIELDDLDIDFANSIVVIEWPKDFIDGSFESWLLIEIDRSSQEDVRQLVITGHGPRWQGVQFDFGD
jgi:tRNA threonylcarbamoyl adenosine modification protein YjeE